MEEKKDIKPGIESFLEQHRLFIWKLCNRYADGELADGLDHVQEITILLWLRYHKLRPGASLRQQRKWISYIARDYFRKITERQRPDIVPFSHLGGIPTVVSDDADTPSELLDDYLQVLDPSDRWLVECYVRGYRSHELAKVFSISAEAVRQRLHRAIGHIKEYAHKIDKI